MRFMNQRLSPGQNFDGQKWGKSQPFDPLKFIIEEAHKRGILVHAWFNPCRAYHPAAKTVSENHISKSAVPIWSGNMENIYEKAFDPTDYERSTIFSECGS